MWRVTEVRYSDNKDVPLYPWCVVTYQNGDELETVIFRFSVPRRGPKRWTISGVQHGDITNAPKELKRAIREFYPVLRIMNADIKG